MVSEMAKPLRICTALTEDQVTQYVHWERELTTPVTLVPRPLVSKDMCSPRTEHKLMHAQFKIFKNFLK